MKKFAEEFKQFALRGNVLDMAIGVVIGGAFSTIISSLVNDVIMPLISILIKTETFSHLSIVLKNDSEGVVTLNYGMFIQNIINFLIIAMCLFIAIKLINSFTQKKKEVEENKPVEKSETVVLLEDIRDLLKKEK